MKIKSAVHRPIQNRNSRNGMLMPGVVQNVKMSLSKMMDGPVAPRMTRGWPENMEKKKFPKETARIISVTPCVRVCVLYGFG